MGAFNTTHGRSRKSVTEFSSSSFNSHEPKRLRMVSRHKSSQTGLEQPAGFSQYIHTVFCQARSIAARGLSDWRRERDSNPR